MTCIVPFPIISDILLFFFLSSQSLRQPPVRQPPERAHSPSIEVRVNSNFDGNLTDEIKTALGDGWGETHVYCFISVCFSVTLHSQSSPVMLKFVTLYMCTLFFQATLVSELNRFEAELDSDIRGLERKLSLKQQQPQRRGRGEVLTLPSNTLWSSKTSFFYPLHLLNMCPCLHWHSRFPTISQFSSCLEVYQMHFSVPNTTLHFFFHQNKMKIVNYYSNKLIIFLPCTIVYI